MPKASLLIALLFLALLPARAQTVGASLQGTVSDPTGAIIPGAKIEIRNVETGVASTLTSDSTGHFRAPVLQPGDYELRVLAQGFQTVLRKGLHLVIGQEAVLDVALQLGATAGEVSVTTKARRGLDHSRTANVPTERTS